MTGRGHLMTGAAVLLDMAACAALSRYGDGASALRQAGGLIVSYMSPWYALGGGIRGAAGCAAALLFYAAGLLLPDLDNKNSLACRATRIHISIRHRGWTHSVWAILPAAAMAYTYMPFTWLAAGMLMHDLADALSQAGWVPFYPFGNWRVYHNTVMRRGWTPGFYSSARPGSEEAACGVIVSLCVAFAGYAFYAGFWPKGA